MAEIVDFPRISTTLRLVGLGLALAASACAVAPPEPRRPAGPPTAAPATAVEEPSAADAERADAERWRRWAKTIEQLGARVEARLLALSSVPGPFEVESSQAIGGADDGGGQSAQPPSELGRLLHERLVLAVARGWLEEARGCLSAVGSRGSTRCGARGWGAALEAGESLPVFLGAADQHVTVLREQAALARALAEHQYGDRAGALAQAIAELGPMGLLGAADAEGKLGKREEEKKEAGKLKLKLDELVDAEPPKPATPITGRCAPGDPLCSWAGEDKDDYAALIPEERGRAAAVPAGKPKPAAPTPTPVPGGVAAAVVAPGVAVLEGVMPLVRAHLGEIGGCLPDPEGNESAVRIEVKARVAPDGAMRDVQVGPPSELPPTAASCVVGILQQLRAPPPSDGGSHVVSFPLWVAGGAR